MNAVQGLIQVYRNIATENLTGSELIDAFDTADEAETFHATQTAVIEAAREYLDRANNFNARYKLSQALAALDKVTK